MNRTTSEIRPRSEAEEIRRWRFDQLMAAGYDGDSASALADQLGIDLHLATDLVRKGCPPQTAVRILV